MKDFESETRDDADIHVSAVVAFLRSAFFVRRNDAGALGEQGETLEIVLIPDATQFVRDQAEVRIVVRRRRVAVIVGECFVAERGFAVTRVNRRGFEFVFHRDVEARIVAFDVIRGARFRSDRERTRHSRAEIPARVVFGDDFIGLREFPAVVDIRPRDLAILVADRRGRVLFLVSQLSAEQAQAKEVIAHFVVRAHRGRRLAEANGCGVGTRVFEFRRERGVARLEDVINAVGQETRVPGIKLNHRHLRRVGHQRREDVPFLADGDRAVLTRGDHQVGLADAEDPGVGGGRADLVPAFPIEVELEFRFDARGVFRVETEARALRGELPARRLHQIHVRRALSIGGEDRDRFVVGVEFARRSEVAEVREPVRRKFNVGRRRCAQKRNRREQHHLFQNYLLNNYLILMPGL